MSDERWDFIVLRPVAGQLTDRTLYAPGEGIMGQVVDDLGLVVGEDVTPARANSMEQPAGNATRAEWVRYAQIQAYESGHPTQEELDSMTRDQIRDLFTEPTADTTKPAKAAKGAAPVKGD